MNKAQTPWLCAHWNFCIYCVVCFVLSSVQQLTFDRGRVCNQRIFICVKMYFTGVFLLFLLQEVASGPLYRRIPSAKFTNISRDAFKKLNSETWQGSALTDNEDTRLFEPSKNRKNPRTPHLNSTKLKQLLGDGYDPKFMSETKPNRAWLETKNQLDRRTEFEAFKRKQKAGESITELLDKKQTHLNEVEFEDIRFWLWNMTRCAVEPLWKDFGAHVWPRYVNFGKCSNKPSCSLPSGMKCRPSEKKRVRLLYWLCPMNAKKCSWSSLEMKVIRACNCSCL